MTESSVSRETSPPPAPEQARGVFADRLGLAEEYARLLATQGVLRGLIGPREAPRIWERHLLNCAVLEEIIDHGASVCDVGSGAGLPGIVLAIARPDVSVTLVEPLLRRTIFLDEVAAELELANVTVVRARAEACHGGERYDVVTSRAVAALPRLLDWCMPLVAPSGEMIALKGSGVATEILEAGSLLAERGCGPARVVELGLGRVPESTWAVRIAWRDPASVSSDVARPPASAKRATTSGRRRRRADGR